MNFSTLKSLTIPEGVVTKITDASGTVLWSATPSIPVDYLGFGGGDTVSISVATPGWDGTMYYSTDKETWYEWDGSKITGSSLYLAGEGNTVVTGNGTNYAWTLTNSSNVAVDTPSIICTGNIETLLDHKTVTKGGHPTMGDYCFAYMFYQCEKLGYAPRLSATTLSNYCYTGMFQECTELKEAPELPATIITGKSPYGSMFRGCTALKAMPALPAKSLGGMYSYQYMFYGCTALTEVQPLPCLNLGLATYPYQYMFYGCTSLTTAPELPATTLSTGCYQYMFYGCISLATAPDLPATSLANYCYRNMFSKCTSLTTAPSLPATTMKSYCYYSMFSQSGLTTAPALPATTLSNNCYQSMFTACESLVIPPALPSSSVPQYCYSLMFNNCSNLIALPYLPATKLSIQCYANMFAGCSKIKLSSSQTGEYTQTYRIPMVDTGTTASNAMQSMFASTGGTFKSTPTINTTYYLHTDNSIVNIDGTTE